MSKCCQCGTTKDVSGYIIADDLENPRPYCPRCFARLQASICMLLCDIEMEPEDIPDGLVDIFFLPKDKRV